MIITLSWKERPWYSSKIFFNLISNLSNPQRTHTHPKHHHLPKYENEINSSLFIFNESNMEIFSPIESLNFERLKSAENSREFDDEFSIKVLNEGSSDNLYKNHSCASYVDKIHIPTLFINALDDPISKKSAIPFEAFQRNPNIILATTERGGHVAFVDHLFPLSFDGTPKFSWLEKACVQFVHVFSEIICASKTTGNRLASGDDEKNMKSK